MSTTEHTESKLLQLVQTELKALKPELGELHMDTDLIADLGLDSVQVLDMCAAIEDELDISIPVNRLADVRSAGQLVAVLQQLLEE